MAGPNLGQLEESLAQVMDSTDRRIYQARHSFPNHSLTITSYHELISTGGSFTAYLVGSGLMSGMVPASAIDSLAMQGKFIEEAERAFGAYGGFRAAVSFARRGNYQGGLQSIFDSVASHIAQEYSRLAALAVLRNTVDITQPAQRRSIAHQLGHKLELSGGAADALMEVWEQIVMRRVEERRRFAAMFGS